MELIKEDGTNNCFAITEKKCKCKCVKLCKNVRKCRCGCGNIYGSAGETMYEYPYGQKYGCAGGSVCGGNCKNICKGLCGGKCKCEGNYKRGDIVRIGNDTFYCHPDDAACTKFIRDENGTKVYLCKTYMRDEKIYDMFPNEKTRADLIEAIIAKTNWEILYYKKDESIDDYLQQSPGSYMTRYVKCGWFDQSKTVDNEVINLNNFSAASHNLFFNPDKTRTMELFVVFTPYVSLM